MAAVFSQGLTGALTACASPTPPKTVSIESSVPLKEPILDQSAKMDGNTARDGQIAIKEEFDAAMAANTPAALKFFIKRHPNSQWTDAAAAQLRVVQKGKPKN